MVITTYDEKREVLRTKLKEALEYSRENLLNPNIWGYEDMRQSYAVEVYNAIYAALDKV